MQIVKVGSILSKVVRDKIDYALHKYPVTERQSAIKAALFAVQEENGGWIKNDDLDAVATYLQMSKIAVYEVATFYTMFELNPVGKHKICVCTNISCMLKGSEGIVTHIQDKLGIGFGETTDDGKFTLKEVECLAGCGGAPMMQIGADYYQNLDNDKVDAILANLAELD